MQASIKANPTFKAPIEIRRPGDEPMKFTGVFKHRTRDQFDALAKEARENPKADLDAVMDVLVGWEGMVETFSRDAVGELLQNFHDAADLIAATYVRELGAARRGN
jgi:hypothetical protein